MSLFSVPHLFCHHRRRRRVHIRSIEFLDKRNEYVSPFVLFVVLVVAVVTASMKYTDECVHNIK